MAMETCPRCGKDCPSNEIASYGGHEDCDPCTDTPPSALDKPEYSPEELAAIARSRGLKDEKKPRDIRRMKDGRWAKTKTMYNSRGFD